jgi:hypothetical protein
MNHVVEIEWRTIESSVYPEKYRTFVAGRFVRRRSATTRPAILGISTSVTSRWIGPSRLAAICSASWPSSVFEHGVAIALQDAAGERPNRLIVFDEENGLGAAGSGWHGGSGRADDRLHARQKDPERRADALRARDLEVAVALLDEPVDHGQPQPAALAWAVGREERLEQMG